MKDIKQLDARGQEATLLELTRELRDVKEQVRLGKEKNHARLRYIKKDVARVKTLLNNQKV